MKPRLNLTQGLAQTLGPVFFCRTNEFPGLNQTAQTRRQLGRFYHSNPSGLNFEGHVEAKITTE